MSDFAPIGPAPVGPAPTDPAPADARSPDPARPDPSPPAAASADGETLVTDITIQPDGRVYVFGTSRQVLEVLEVLNPADLRLQHLLGHVRTLEAGGVASDPKP